MRPDDVVSAVLARFRALADDGDADDDYYMHGTVDSVEIRALCDAIEDERRAALRAAGVEPVIHERGCVCPAHAAGGR